jgi:hypothetical protein
MRCRPSPGGLNALNAVCILGRWMRIIVIPNQSSVANAYDEFDEAGRMKPSPYYDRLVSPRGGFPLMPALATTMSIPAGAAMSTAERPKIKGPLRPKMRLFLDFVHER